MKPRPTALLPTVFLIGAVLIAPIFAQAPVPAAGGDESTTETRGMERGGGSGSPAEIASTAYARGDWETAVAQYRALVAEGYADPVLFYNLGTAYARAGDKGRAVWMLLKAARLDPRNGSIWNNLERIAPDLASQMAFFPLPPLEAVYRSLRLNEWALVGGMGTLTAGLGAALVLFLSPVHRRRKLARRLAWAGLVVGVVGHGFAAAKYFQEVAVVRGVVSDPETTPHSAPSEASEVYAFTLPAGTLIRVQNAGVDGWIKAVYGGKNEVFIRTGQFERL